MYIKKLGVYMTTNKELAQALRCNLFADRGTDIKAAIDYSMEIAKTSGNAPAVTTALFVVLNTLANVLETEVEAV